MKKAASTHIPEPEKIKTGIAGFDQITFGGLPKERATLVSGGPGCGKSLFAMQCIVNGALQFGEPGIYISFEESPADLQEDFASFGFDLSKLARSNKFYIEHIVIDQSPLETGDYNLDGLFIRIAQAIKKVGAKRVALDTVEALFGGYSDSVLRSELHRLFRWLKEQGVTTVITAEKGSGTVTRYGLEEYVSDCVIYFDHRVESQLSTRRLRVIKYRGSIHGTNEYPFLIDDSGITVLPITSVGLNYAVTKERVSTGIPQLDAMFEEKGYYKGSTVLISGTAGTGKSSVASLFADAACRQGKKCLYFAFEESSGQIVRNMESIGIHFQRWLKKKLLHFYNVRPTVYGLEMHLVMMHKYIKEIQPDMVILDPISNLISQGPQNEVKSMLLRVIDFLKTQNVTTLMTNLTSKNENFEHIEINVSSIADTWIMLRDLEVDGELKRGLFIVKSRGMSHSNKVREFVITNRGIRILDTQPVEKLNKRVL